MCSLPRHTDQGGSVHEVAALGDGLTNFLIFVVSKSVKGKDIS